MMQHTALFKTIDGRTVRLCPDYILEIKLEDNHIVLLCGTDDSKFTYETSEVIFEHKQTVA